MGTPAHAKHDELLLALARGHGNIEELLDTFFGFLRRRTDFFHVMAKPDAKMGFPAGVAERMTLEVFRRHQVCGFVGSEEDETEAASRRKSSFSEASRRKSSFTSSISEDSGERNRCLTSNIDKVSSERQRSSENVFSEGFVDEFDGGDLSCGADSGSGSSGELVVGPDVASSGGTAATVAEASSGVTGVIATDEVSGEAPHVRGGTEYEVMPSKSDSVVGALPSSSTDPPAAVGYENCVSMPPAVSDAVTENSKLVEQEYKDGHQKNSSHVPDKSQTSDFYRISTYNGGTTDRYRWTQTQTDLTMEIHVSSKSCTGKDIKVAYRTQDHIHVTCRDEVLLSGQLADRVNRDDCTWVLEDKCRLIISIEKSREGWWVKVMEGDPEIDGKSIESVKHVHEYPEETQGAIRKIVFDRNQKSQGLQTSEELQREEIMRRAWDAEGSPFKGTAYNPEVLRDAVVGGNDAMMGGAC